MKVKIKGLGVITFPDEMSEEDVLKALEKYRRKKDESLEDALTRMIEGLKQATADKKPVEIERQVFIEKPVPFEVEKQVFIPKTEIKEIEKPVIIEKPVLEKVEIEVEKKPKRWRFKVNYARNGRLDEIVGTPEYE